MGLWEIIPWDMYINIAVSNLLTPTHCTHIEIFLLKAGIISTDINITFDDKVEKIRYDSEEASDELGINKNWKPQNQVTID